MNWIDLVGTLAGICTTIAVVPQIRQAWKTKKVENVSPPMFIIMMCGVGLWTVYGVMKSDPPIIITNGISFILNSILLYLLIRYRSKK